MAIIVGTAEIKQDTPLVSFSFGGGIGANLSPIARIIGENVFKKTIGKKLAGKATAFVAKKVGTKLVAGAAGTAVSGPVGIAATVISFGKDILSFFSRKLKEHPELLMLPVIGVGFALGLPGLVIGGFGGGLVLVAGGPAQAIGIAGAGISTVAAAFMSLLVAASIGPIIAVIVGIPLLTALIVFIINTGAYVVPLEGLGLGVGPIPTECTGDPGPAPQPAQPYVRGIYSYPVDNYPNTSYPCYHWDHEKAVDMWSTETHPPLVAYTDGVIENVTLGDPLGGKYIILAGDDGRFYYYAHTCHVYVNVGDRVTRGQTVATMDNTGNATDQHLHFAINSTSVFAGGSGDVCPQTDFEEKFGFGRCTDPLSNCI